MVSFLGSNALIFIGVIGPISSVVGEKIKCYSDWVDGDGDLIVEEKECPEGVTQCVRRGNSNTPPGATKKILYGCHDGIAPDGCETLEHGEWCICTGNLCNSSSTNSVNFMLALSCLMIAYFKFAF